MTNFAKLFNTIAQPNNNQKKIPVVSVLEVFYGLSSDGHMRLSFLSKEKAPKLESTKFLRVSQGEESSNVYWTCFDLLHDDAKSIFYTFCDDLVSAITEVKVETTALNMLKKRFIIWKTMFKQVQTAAVSKEVIQGLFGEMYFLKNYMLENYSFSEAKELNQLKNENDYFDKLEELKDIYKSKTELLTTQTMIQAGLLQESLNSKMTELNGTIFVESTTAPRITFISPKQYEFYTPNDDGTGTNFKGMVVLDLACLSLTALPAIVHDSYVLKQISKTSIEKIFELYAASEKQIFVAFDNLLAYTEKTVKIVNSHTVLELAGSEDCLFGKYFGSRIKK